MKSIWGPILAVTSSVVHGSVPSSPWEISKDSWIQEDSFFNPFSYLEKKQHFCRRSWMLPASPEVVYFSVMDELEEVSKLRELCEGAQTKLDQILLDQVNDHPWKVPLGDRRAVLHYFPTFAGPVLAGECGETAVDLLARLMAKVRSSMEWIRVGGHNFIHLASTPHVYETVYNQTKAIFRDHYRYDQKEMTDSYTKDNIPYALSQMISLQDVYVPGLQYCQLFRPLAVRHTPDIPSDNVPSWDEYKESRPIDFLIAESVGVLNDPKYAVRQRVIQDLARNESGQTKIILLEADDFAAVGVDTPTACSRDADAPICTAKDMDELSALRAEYLPQAKWYIVTRGDKPHEENLYQAMWSETLIVNSIDKNLDHALPFQCSVQWEDFTVRVGSDKTRKNPVQEMKKAISNLSDLDLTKMLRYMKYYGPELDYGTTYDGRDARNSTNLVENIMLGGMRRCYPEQWLNERRMSAGQMQCCGNEYAKFSVIPRRQINVDVPPWRDY